MIWIALAVGLVAALSSLALAGVRAWRLWKTGRATSDRLNTALARVAEAGAVTEERALGLGASSERLATATARLQQSLAAFAVIREAASEPAALLASLRALAPRR